MTEEEKEIIDNLTMKAITSSAEAPDYPNCIVMKKNLITVLNLIQKQDKKIKDLKEHNSNLIKKSGEDIDLLLKQIDSKDTEINKLNNVIDIMAEYIYSKTDFTTCGNIKSIKEYFMKDNEVE